MARDRKRAKQRRAAAISRRPSRAGGAGAGGASNGAPPSEQDVERASASLNAPGAIERADLPGALGHIGTEDEFDAALVRGAGGAPVTDKDAEEFNAEAEDALQEPAGPSGPGGPDGGGGGGVGGGGGDVARPSGAPLRGGNRAIGFLRASWAELQRVQWPDRRQVTQATAVVIGFVAVAGVYLGLADTVAKEIVEFIL